jgi:DNA-binding beta-propeller fold protein YncE
MKRNTVSTLAGSPAAYGGEDHRNGEGKIAQFNSPSGVAVDRDGNGFVADAFNHCIRKITPQGLVSTLAGTREEGYQDGEGTVAQFNIPTGVVVGGGWQRHCG